MPSLTVKNIPAPIYERLKEAAARNHRSLNSELIACLEQKLCATTVDVEAHLGRARTLRASVTGDGITLQDFEELKRQGRE